MDNVYTIDSKGRCRKKGKDANDSMMDSLAATLPASIAGIGAMMAANAAGATTLLGITIISAPAWIPLTAGAAASLATGYAIKLALDL